MDKHAKFPGPPCLRNKETYGLTSGSKNPARSQRKESEKDSVSNILDHSCVLLPRVHGWRPAHCALAAALCHLLDPRATPSPCHVQLGTQRFTEPCVNAPHCWHLPE